MASSLAMASFVSGVAVVKQPPVPRRSLVVAKAVGSAGQDATKIGNDDKDTRRAVVFTAAAAAAVCAVGKSMALAEPKRGTPEAKKLYAPVCVTMPTARICHK